MDFDLKNASEEDSRITNSNPDASAMESRTSSNEAQHQNKPKNKKKAKKVITIILVLLILGGLAYGGWWLYQEQMDAQAKKDTQIAALQQEKTELQNQIQQLTTQLEESDQKEPAASEALLNNIRAAVRSGNHAALEGFMTEKVAVAIAGSEGVGEFDPAGAVEEMALLANGTEPWDFSLSDEALDEYREGGYGQYFSETAFVGRSANRVVVVFDFSEGAISSIFMADAGVL